MKGEAAALSVRAQRCQSHYFSSTPRTKAAVDKTSYPSTVCGNKLVFDIRTPEKYHCNQIMSAPCTQIQQTTKFDYIPYEI